MNCRVLYIQELQKIRHFAERARVLGKSPSEVVIVILNVNDLFGGEVAEKLMPGHDWSPLRQRGLIPIAAGLAEREEIEELVEIVDPILAAQFRAYRGLAVVVASEGEVAVFQVPPKAN